MDLAPTKHESSMREGSIHIGSNIHVKWHKYRGTNYIMIRHIVDGAVDGRRGINFNMKLMDNLKKAINTDTAVTRVLIKTFNQSYLLSLDIKRA